MKDKRITYACKACAETFQSEVLRNCIYCHSSKVVVAAKSDDKVLHKGKTVTKQAKQ